MEHYLIKDGYDRTKNPQSIKVRDFTFEEALALTYGSHVDFIANNGTLRTVKINGKVKTWKRDPRRLEVPVKYGMYECATFRWFDGAEGFLPGLVSDSHAVRMVKREE